MATRTHTPDVISATTGDLDKHPKGLYVLFATEMWERFSFYSMLALFTLYLQNDKQGFGWTDARATSLYAWYLAFVYGSPLVGGWIADKKLGYRKAVMIGGFFFMAGHLLLSVPSLLFVYLALACLVIGNGFFKPNVSTMVGNLYPEGSHLKDRAYNIFYMGINIGAFVAPIVMEIVKDKFGYHPAFAVAAFGMLISVSILWRFKNDVEQPERGTIDRLPAKVAADAAAVTEDAPPTGISHQHTERQNAMDAVPEWKRIAALIVIFLIVIVFWMAFHQNGSTLTYWADDNTDWNVSGTISNAINPFWIIVLTFPLVWFWKQLDKRGKEPATPTKMVLGMLLTALSFTILYFAARTGEAKEVRPDMYPGASFRVTDRALANLRAAGVPEDVLQRLGDSKDAEAKALIKGKKFSDDKTFSDAFETIKLNLRAEGLPEDVYKKMKNAKIDDGELAGSSSFPGALEKVAQNLKAEGVPDDVLQRMRSYDNKRFTSEEKLSDAIKKVLGDEQATRYAPAIFQQAFLFRVSPLWLILSYMVISLGELMLSPMGLSLVSKVAPIRMRGLMMGGWFVATAIGNKLTAIGVYWSIWNQSTFFIVLGGMAFIMAIVLFVLLRPLKKAMPGV
jgi:proton-dependent oligopeptide transporter, POT family